MRFYDDYEDEFYNEPSRKKSKSLKKFKKDDEFAEKKRDNAKRDANRKKERESKRFEP